MYSSEKYPLSVLSLQALFLPLAAFHPLIQILAAPFNHLPIGN